ncbi:MAG: glycosyltransferase family 9 protein [Bacteroidota bacterium]|nr:glycosyltransferase family 9 protein [Bacteroidota bacterium]
MRSAEQVLKRFLYRAMGKFFSPPVVSSAALPFESLRRILIVRQHDQLGDLLIATPAIRAVRKKFPKAHLAVVVREYTEPMMRNNPHVDEVIIFYERLRRWNYHRLKTFWLALRAGGGYDCAIVLNTVSRSLSSDIIALLSKAKYIVGSDHLPHETHSGEKIYNLVVHRSPGQETEIERNLDIVRALEADEADLEYDLVPTHKERIEAGHIFLALGLPEAKMTAGVHFGAIDPTRCFPLHKLAQVIDFMVERFDVNVVLIAGPNEIERRTFLLSHVHHKVFSAPVMPLRVMAAFVRHLQLFLCNDTGTLHIAASQRVPTVSFHGANDPAVWKPPHPRHIAVRADDALITSITIEQVMNAVERTIAGR